MSSGLRRRTRAVPKPQHESQLAAPITPHDSPNAASPPPHPRSYRPTFDGNSLTIETFLLAEGPVEAPPRIEVEFLSFVRNERKFATPEALKARILRDVGTAKRFHQRFGDSLAKTCVG